ncbi:MAG: hypothetical protein IJK92_06275 [Bacteroidales bacterium]|nr:hypothetical protein [Bacteroidales bacterium]
MSKKAIIAFAFIVLFATIANAQAVGTYKASKAKVVTEKIKKPQNPTFVGFNAGMAATLGSLKAINFTAGLDLAFPIGTRFAWGFYMGYQTPAQADLGLIFVHGDYTQGGAFIWGFGPIGNIEYRKNLEYEGVTYERTYRAALGFMFRIGFKSKSPLYYNLAVSKGKVKRLDQYPEHNNIDDSSSYGINLTVGYRLNTKRKN